MTQPTNESQDKVEQKAPPRIRSLAYAMESMSLAERCEALLSLIAEERLKEVEPRVVSCMVDVECQCGKRITQRRQHLFPNDIAQKETL